jgi:hypothetical protein
MKFPRARRRFFGKYRGTVFDNFDPEFKGRIIVKCTDVLGDVPSTYATPCVPVTGIAGLQSGVFVLPPLDASVWVEFEHGDCDFPIWSGCFWGSASEVPTAALVGTVASPNIVLQTAGQNTVMISGDPVTGITLVAGPLADGTSPRITITKAGIVMTDGKGGMISVAGGAVQMNQGALLVK